MENVFFPPEAKGAISVKGVYLHQVSGKTGSCRCQEPAFLSNWLAHTFFVFVYLWLVLTVRILFSFSSLGRSKPQDFSGRRKGPKNAWDLEKLHYVGQKKKYAC